MLKVKLTPDDVLKGAGGYREETEIECPVCGGAVKYETDCETTECDACGQEFGVDKPFS